ncbi:DinB family protein [Arthrobacter sp. 35W]|uniref:DinB family protein n=1 Tax=Arthrobacter sp. 35W TaxID=1132441 RepID=UPI0004004C31|nr:DinB family protein [Arthrobacter sp. 35W]
MDAQREGIIAGYGRACSQLDGYLANATTAQLRGRSAGTKWTNEELLFHMVFGYMVVRALLPLVRIMSRLPRSWGRAFARGLDAATGPFDVVNYWGSRAAALVFNRHRMDRKLEKTTHALARRLARETPASLERAMDFPTRWDPFFAQRMSLADVYAYPTRHFDFHTRQLTLDRP